MCLARFSQLGRFDHIAWSCPCRPIDLVIPPKPGEFLSSRFGWAITNRAVDNVAVQAWLVRGRMFMIDLFAYLFAQHPTCHWCLSALCWWVRCSCPLLPAISSCGHGLLVCACVGLAGGLVWFGCFFTLFVGVVWSLRRPSAVCFLGVVVLASAAAAALHQCAVYLGAVHFTKSTHTRPTCGVASSSWSMRTPAGERTAWRELKETLGVTPKFSLDFGLVFTGVTWVSSGRISLGTFGLPKSCQKKIQTGT